MEKRKERSPNDLSENIKKIFNNIFEDYENSKIFLNRNQKIQKKKYNLIVYNPPIYLGKKTKNENIKVNISKFLKKNLSQNGFLFVFILPEFKENQKYRNFLVKNIHFSGIFAINWLLPEFNNIYKNLDLLIFRKSKKKKFLFSCLKNINKFESILSYLVKKNIKKPQNLSVEDEIKKSKDGIYILNPNYYHTDCKKLNIFRKLLKDPFLGLPVTDYLKRNQNNHYFPNFIKKKMDNFIEKIKLTKKQFKIEEKSSLISDNDINLLDTTISKLSEGIKKYFIGDLYESSKILRVIFNNNKLALLDNTPNIKSRVNKIKTYYRARYSEKYYQDIVGALDLYHPPFEKRYKLKPTRFSNSGIPCLYLSNSLYITWIELYNPNFNHFSFARYSTRSDKLKLVDFSWRPIQYSFYIENELMKINKNSLEDIQNMLKKVINYIKIWPILMSCSIPIASCDDTNTFKPEYIVSQNLIQWITVNSKDFDGIKYFSIKRKYNVTNNYQLSDFNGDFQSQNIAIPIKISKSKGYDKNLLKKFIIHPPSCYQEFEIKDKIKKSQILNFWNNNYEIRYEKKEIPFLYNDTLFGKMEMFLHRCVNEIPKIKKIKLIGKFQNTIDNIQIPKWYYSVILAKYGYFNKMIPFENLKNEGNQYLLITDNMETKKIIEKKISDGECEFEKKQLFTIKEFKKKKFTKKELSQFDQNLKILHEIYK